MIEPERRCPTCGARLLVELRMSDTTSDAPVLVWQCEQQHWWLQSMVHGLVPIEPDATAREAATTTEDASDDS
jgi:DNA-directed RNA polymerase subunit RPC12/RpoP